MSAISRETAAIVSGRDSAAIERAIAHLKFVRDNAASCPPLSYWERRSLSLARDDLDAILNASATDVDGTEIPAPMTGPAKYAEAAE
jgi:hypothetical protein